MVHSDSFEFLFFCFLCYIKVNYMVSYSSCCPFTHYYVYSFPQIRPNGACVASAALCALVPLAAVCAGKGMWSSGVWRHVCVWHDGADAAASSYCEHDFVECPVSVIFFFCTQDKFIFSQSTHRFENVTPATERQRSHVNIRPSSTNTSSL